MQENDDANQVPAEKPAEESPFLDGFQRILKPSFAYLQACQSYPCRISELVFGSLLASYILGFVSVGASRVTAEVDTNVAVATVLIYLSISVTFSYLTAGFYTTYHKSILTMPNVPLDDLTNDFSLAICQAVFFGISMIWIETYLFFVGLLLIIVFVRQGRKVASLATFFMERVGTTPDPELRPTDTAKKDITAFVDAATKISKENKGHLDGWIPVSSKRYIYASIILVIGVVIVYVLHGTIPSKWTEFYTRWNFDVKWVLAVVYIVVGYFLLNRSQATIKRNSVALDKLGKPVVREMDPVAQKLATMLKQAQ